jgi:hypothetical protein
VTLRHISIFFEHELGPRQTPDGGEKDEVEDIKWIPIDEVHNYKWAFNHKKTIIDLFYDFIGPLTSYSQLTTGDFFMLSHPVWLKNNPQVKKILKEKILGTFGIYD